MKEVKKVKRDFTREMLNKIRMVNENNSYGKHLLNEEKGFVIQKNDTKFGNFRQSQEQQLRQTLGDVELDKDAIVFFPENSNIVLNGFIKGMNVKFQFKYNDQSGDGCYITGADVQMTDSNAKTLQKIRAAYENWKSSLDQDATIIDDLEKATESDGNVVETIERRQQLIKESFRSKHKKAETINEDVMNRFYGIKTNGNKPVLIEHITLNRIINKHGDKGLVIISANRSDQPQEYNDEKTKELISDIQNSGFSYLPTYGGYRSPEGIEDNYEPSFVIFNYDTKGNEADFEELRNFAVYCCGKYDQDSVLIKEPGLPPIYVDRNGEKSNEKESDTIWKNDPKQEYFTSLKSRDKVNDEILMKLRAKYKSYCKNNNIKPTPEGFNDFCEENLTNISKIGRRWTYDIQFPPMEEHYVNPMPCQLTERMRRKGEIMVWE